MAAPFSQNSRFACLTIDDDDESDDRGQNKQVNQNGAKAATAKKRNRKKKKVEQAEKAELRELAFCLGGSSSKPKKQTPALPNAKKAVGSGENEEQWNEWRKADEELMNEKYESDLQQAILQSKLDFERNEELKEPGGPVNEPTKDSKKKKKKKATMSLEEFSHFDENKEPDEEEPLSNQPKSPTKIICADPDFFDRVDKDASKTVMKEKIQEEYTKQYIVQNARTAHYEKEISKKDKEIVMLRATVAKLKEEALDAKQRNQQLCNILAQGEMKDKAAVLQSLEELNQVKNELMDEINHLTAELEKEKSKSHALKTELERYQAKSSKHK